MKTKLFLLALCLTLLTTMQPKTYAQSYDTVTVAFWNVENFFDTLDNKAKNDEEFLPGAKKQWGSERYLTKIQHLGQAVKEMNAKRGPDILGMAEIENKAVVEDLVKAQFPEMKYEIVHIQSPDERGISTAMLFRTSIFKLVSVVGDTIHLSDNHPTRLILHVILQGKNKVKVHVFVNHWPSRLGGEEKSEGNRIAAAKELRKNVDAVLTADANAAIVIMGDFNDEPDNNSIKNELKAEQFICDSANYSYSLHNLAWQKKRNGEGTLKYRNQWNMLDQIIVSSSVLKTPQKAFSYICNSFQVFKADYMIEHGEKYEGSPLPTYGGSKYLGGYSDHFPVLAKFLLEKGKTKK